ncbi:5642_t:CDS:10 [Diversispora eburnea]|uniref:5642_t:CDS:1 n=1 Tax=Diversispora eburnea TaxID=1213867 RepID=A0A9N8W6R4_9GLOM|nr:5642_t:CDS:10 [Diversispora eburnea]
MADPRSFKDKYYRLREKYDALNKQRDELKHNLEITKHRARKLKEENNHLLDLMMDLNPSLVDDATGSSSEDIDLLSDASSDDDTSINAMSRYEQTKPLIKDYKRKALSSSSRKPRSLPQEAMTTTTTISGSITSPNNSNSKNIANSTSTTTSTTNNINTNTSGKRKSDEGVGGDELPTQKRRRKAPGVKKKRDDRTDAKRIEPLPMNPDRTLKLPVTIGKGTNEVTIYRIGEIIWDREAYHTNRYIFPVGFMSKKQYLSAVDVTRRTTYTSEILDGGDNPIVLTAEDQPGRKFAASSSSGVWKKILDEINVQGVPSKTHASGPEMLGLSHLGITKYIQKSKYMPQEYLQALLGLSSTETYLVDAYSIKCASAISVNKFICFITFGIISNFSVSIQDALGIDWTFTLLPLILL